MLQYRLIEVFCIFKRQSVIEMKCSDFILFQNWALTKTYLNRMTPDLLLCFLLCFVIPICQNAVDNSVMVTGTTIAPSYARKTGILTSGKLIFDPFPLPNNH